MNREIKEILKVLEIKSKRYNHHLKYGVSYENTDEDYQAHLLLDYITNLQKTQEILIKNDNEIITNLQEENKKLKELCDKYEEEHNNEFQCWKRDRKELLDKKARIDKAIEYINLTGYGTDFSMSAEEVDVLFNILKGE